LKQTSIAEHLDLTQPTVSRLLAELDIDLKTATLKGVRIAYIRHLREQAAGRATSGGLDLADERARLAKEQADRVALQNAVSRRELAPVVLIEETLCKAASKIAGIFDGIPGMIRRRNPRLNRAEIDMISAEIARARNLVASMSLADLDEAPGAADVCTEATEGNQRENDAP
jgi:phage terminase Nu1 subunit (DNA packaging protein)